MRDYLLIIELALARQNIGKANVFDVVAKGAEWGEADKSLDVSVIVVAPYFVAVHLPIRATNGAMVMMLCVHFSANLVPLRFSQRLAHVAVPARLWHKLNF
jgi:hypothetical protein